mgnify:CR=1 FL=1
MFFIQTIKRYLWNKKYESERPQRELKELNKRITRLEYLLKVRTPPKDNSIFFACTYSWFGESNEWTADLGKGVIRVLKEDATTVEDREDLPIEK